MTLQCKGITIKGSQCKREATIGEYCKQHDPTTPVVTPIEIKGLGAMPVENTVTIMEPMKVPTETPQPEKKPTRPWDADSNPWSIDTLRLKKQHPGFRPRFIVKNPENIEKYTDRGWVIADKRHYGGVAEEIVGETGTLDTTLKRRELILMELPEELAKKRAEYIDYKTNKRAEEARNAAKNAVRKIEKELGAKVLIEDRFETRRGTFA